MKLLRSFSPSSFVRGAAMILAATGLAACKYPRNWQSAQPQSSAYGAPLRALPADDSTPLYNAAASMNVPTHATTLNDVARMLAGMEASGYDQLSGIRGSAAWQQHRHRLDLMWATHESLHRGPIQSWAAREIGDLRRSSTLFYPFSGPDFLFADAFFPGAETYVLCGLEGADPMPQLGGLSAGEIESGLARLRTTLSSSMQFSYFITKDMRNDLNATRFRGVLPVMMVFLARTGHVIDSVDTVRLDGGGNVTMAGSSGNTGLMVRFHGGWGGQKRLFYFRQDLSNGGLSGSFQRFVQRFGRVPVFTKSASYLMHESGFSRIKDFILRNASGIVQDPSGIPYADFGRYGWNLSLYGNYQGTLEIFTGCQQPDLVQAYRSGRHPVAPLPFGIGYLFQAANTSLMVARLR
ncbi:MAG: hypothetical protein HS117_00485 [Verrucomicrobiaceae bacterium]|nr:hypothetical protein [Verrucomicrobiaceae bacterium]